MLKVGATLDASIMPPLGINGLQRHIRPLRASLADAAMRVIDSGWYVLGQEVEQFEAAFSSYCGARYCISVANGTDALELALRALGICAGSRVATVGNAGMYSSCAILAIGAVPQFVDVDPLTLLLDLNEVEKLFEASPPDALIVTHLYGHVPDMSRVTALCSRYGVRFIEDCAQAHGASWHKKKVGTFGEIGTYSFYPTKNLGALGDGGAAITSSQTIADQLRALRQYGWSKKYTSSIAHGRNSRLDEIQAALLSVKLEHLDGWNERRRKIDFSYSSLISHPKLRHIGHVGDGDVAHLFVMLAEGRDDLRRHLGAANIATDVHYPIPDYRQPALADAFSGLTLARTETACANAITLPCFPEMSDDEVRFVAERVNAWR